MSVQHGRLCWRGPGPSVNFKRLIVLDDYNENINPTHRSVGTYVKTHLHIFDHNIFIYVICSICNISPIRNQSILQGFPQFFSIYWFSREKTGPTEIEWGNLSFAYPCRIYSWFCVLPIFPERTTVQNMSSRIFT